jgi:SAM-dependent methyltransferase
LEHLDAPGCVFSEVSRILAPGGRFVFLTPNRRHPLLLLNRLLSSTAGQLVGRFYDRAEEDTFPALYRANAPGPIRASLESAGFELVDLVLVGDPSYLAFSEPLYRLACLLERITPETRRVHLVGEARVGARQGREEGRD